MYSTYMSILSNSVPDFTVRKEVTTTSQPLPSTFLATSHANLLRTNSAELYGFFSYWKPYLALAAPQVQYLPRVLYERFFTYEEM